MKINQSGRRRQGEFVVEEMISTEDLSNYADVAVEMAIGYVPSLLLAIVVLVVGLWIVNRLVRAMGKGFERSKTEPTLASFLQNVVSILLKVLVVISAAGMVGIQTTSFIAVLGAAGLAVGLALQGSLANFAGGVLVLMFRPYRVGDYIEAQGVGGTVKEIQILHTVITTPDNKRIIVPNGAISNGVITNYSAEPMRRVDFVFGISYGDDIGKAREVIKSQIVADARVLADPEPQIVVSNLGDNSVDITVRVWANAADYWGIKFGLTEQVKNAFDQADITIPFPQRDVHLYQEQA
jgi:small conductance mechanosensitive channel